MELKGILPSEIEKRSFEIIKEELLGKNIILPAIEEAITMRVIHTTADFDYADSMIYSKDAIAIARNLIKNGASIVTDTNMTKAGINKNRLSEYGGRVYCFMADEDVAIKARENNTTRAFASMEKAASIDEDVIFAIGNAPTALIALKTMMDEGRYIPKMVIGVPVGFVNVEYAKELFVKGTVPYIINRGRKGGSNVAAAICNGLIYGIDNE